MADLVVLTRCEEPMASAKKVERIEKFIKTQPEATVIPTVFRPNHGISGG
jgi:cyclic 2,3-diphosphoglycerate synthetase